MHKQLTDLQAKLTAMISRAEVMTESDNDDTVTRYELVIDALGAASDAIDEAIDAFK